MQVMQVVVVYNNDSNHLNMATSNDVHHLATFFPDEPALAGIISILFSIIP